MKTVILAFLAVVAAADVSEAKPTCRGSGSANAASLSFDLADSAVKDGLPVSLVFGLQPASFPVQDISRNQQACARGEFEAGGVRYRLFGDDSDTPPRWAIGKDKRRIAYVALIPDPVDASEWSKRQASDPATPARFDKMLYALTVTDGDKRLVYQISRAIADDYHLSMSMKAALEGRWTPVAVLDSRSGAVELNGAALAQNQPSSAGLIGQQPGKFTEPDGSIFVSSPGGARHQASGLLCPAEVQGFGRESLAVIDASEGGRDVFCKYFRQEGWFSIFATKLPGQSLDQVFDIYRRDAQGSSPPAASIPAPGSLPSLGVKAVFWKGKEGALQGLWVARRGDWYFELRATYRLGVEAAVATFAQQMIALLPAEAETAETAAQG